MRSFPIRTWWTKGDERGKTFHHSGISARSLRKTCRLGRDQKNYHLGPAALIGPHVRSCWVGGRADLCAAEHLRRVAPDEGNRLGMDESRQEDELLNCGDPTSQPRPPPPVDGDLEEPSCDDLDVSMDAGRVVCLSGREILEKLKSLRSLRRLHLKLKSLRSLRQPPPEVEGPSFFETPPPEVEEPSFFETPSRGPYGRSRRNSVINTGPRQGLVHRE